MKRMGYVLVVAVIGGGVVAAAGLGHAHDPPPTAPVLQADEVADSPRMGGSDERDSTENAADSDSPVIEGTVLETLQAGRYTYVRVGAAGSEGTWTAIPQAKLSVGSHVRIAGATPMPRFHSDALGRTFELVYFGELDGGGANPHEGASAAEVKVGKVARASGQTARSVSEIFAQRAELNGKRVRVHAVVVKRVEGVLDRNWLHVRDGTGSAAKGDQDLVVTTRGNVAVGQLVLIEGSLVKDKDLGAGYRYTALLEDAEVSPAP
jgi:hypothetical protein